MDEIAVIIEKMNARQHNGNKAIVMAATMFLTSSLAYSLYQFNDVNTTLNACLPSIFRVMDYSYARRILCGMARLDLLPVDFASEDPYLIRNVSFGSRHPKTRPMRVCVPIGLGSGIDVDCYGPAAFIKQGFGFIEIGPVSLSPSQPSSEALIQVLPRAVVSSPSRSEGSSGLSAVSNRLCDYIEFSRPDDLLTRNSVTGISIVVSTPQNIDQLFDQSFSRLHNHADYVCLDVQAITEPSQISEIIQQIDFCSKNFTSLPPIYIKVGLAQSFPPSPKIVEAISNSQSVVGINLCGHGLLSNEKKFPNFPDSDLLVAGEMVRERAAEAVSNWYQLLRPFGKQIIASGGISCGKDALNLIESGASMINVYSSYVCNGPQIARQIKSQLSIQLMNKGYYNLEEAIGSKFAVNKRRMNAMKRRKKF